MPTLVKRFEVKQTPPSTLGNWWPYVLFSVTILVCSQTAKGSPWGAVVFATGLAATVLAVIRWKPAACVILIESEKMHIEVIKPGIRLPLGTEVYLWKDLVAFQYDFGTTDSDPSLQVRWSDGSSQTLVSGDTKALYEHLHEFFPDKEKEPPGLRFG